MFKLGTFNILAHFKFILFIVVLIFTFILRAHNYERVPTSNHLDEMLYAWSGIHIIETGTPVSWSTLDYPKRAEVFKGKISYKGGPPEASVTLYKPWLDEPPLFSMLVGFFAHINGANRNEFIPSSYIRIPLVYIGTIVSVFIFLIAKKLAGYKTGILAMLIYGITPTFVFASRLAMPENLISLCFVIIMWLLLKYRENLKFTYLSPIPVLIGLAGLSKPTGYFLLLFSVFVTIWLSIKKLSLKKTILKITFLILGTLPFVIYYFWYSNNLDPEIFKIVFRIQSSRPVGFSNFANILISPSYDMTIFRDGWFIFAFVYAIYLSMTTKKTFAVKYISLAFIFWMLVVIFTGGEGDPMAWYRFPIYPILAIISALGLKHLLKLNNLFSTFILFGLLLTSRYLLTTPFNLNVKPFEFKMWLIVALLPSLIYFLIRNKMLVRLNKIIAIIIVAIGMFWNSSLIYQYYDLDCEAKTCPMVPTTKLSELKFPFFWRFLTFRFSK